MRRIQHSIEINVPVHIAYSRLTQFEEYPRFMQDVDVVRQVDDTHLHWTTKTPDRHMEWDAEITEQRTDECIAWRNVSGPPNSGKVELQPVGQERARVTLTMECDPSQAADIAIVQRVEQDLARLKQLIETHGSEAGQPAAEGPEAQAVRQDRDMQGKTQGDPLKGAVGRIARAPQDAAESGAQQADTTTQSAASLSQPSEDQADDGRFSVAEEQNLDQQSDQARRVGQMPEDISAGALREASPADTMAKSVKRSEPDTRD